ncbi:hypothetical protein J23TS9_07390 [Paenibacillus sp. J23TS9]|nr:hypothetical protein J23TS9_07390 [Paenibacillus sp. J23TS9]
MKKALLPLLLCFILILSACGKQSSDDKGAAPDSAADHGDKTITYQSEDGPVEVPDHPERVIVLSTYAGNVISLGVTLVGVDVWSKKSPIFEKDLKAVAEVSDENLEKIIELNPDLIIGLSGSDIKNLDKLKHSSYRYFYLREIGLFNAAFRDR